MDIHAQKRMEERHHKRLATEWGLVAGELDFKEVTRTYNANSNLHPDLETALIRKLEEPYPTRENSCSSNGVLADQE